MAWYDETTSRIKIFFSDHDFTNLLEPKRNLFGCFFACYFRVMLEICIELKFNFLGIFWRVEFSGR